MIVPRVSGVAYRLWKYLESLGRYGGWISVKIRTLMVKYKRAESTVKGWFSELYAAGILASKRRGQHPPVYTVLIPTIRTSEQGHLFTDHEEHELTPNIQHHQSAERKLDDVAPTSPEALKRLAGIPGNRVSVGDRAFLTALDASPEVIRVGILLGRVRKLAQRAQTGRNEPIRSLRYFAGSIDEVRTTSGLAELRVYERSLKLQIARMTA